MEAVRITLVFLHVLIAIFAIVNLHPHLKAMNSSSKDQHYLSAPVYYVNNSIRIILYHSACIAAVWFTRRYSLWMVRGTGVFLIGELLQAMTAIIQKALGTEHFENAELFFIAIHNLMLLMALLITFRFVEKLFKLEQLLVQRESLVRNDNNTLIDAGIEPDFL